MLAAVGVACTMAAAILGAYTRQAPPPLQPPPPIAYAPTTARAVDKPVVQALTAPPVPRMAQARVARATRSHKLARKVPRRLATRATATLHPQAATVVPPAQEARAQDAPAYAIPMVALAAPGASIAPIRIELQRHTRLID